MRSFRKPGQRNRRRTEGEAGARPEAAEAAEAQAPASDDRPAFYAARGGGWRDWWTVLHPPYTAWHLSYVVVGACIAPVVRTSTLVATLLAFFLAVGVAAHVLDELHGRPLGTSIPDRVLLVAGVVGILGALALGVVGVSRVGVGLAVFMAVGTFAVLAYDLELFGGRIHTDAGFALMWGAFPVLTAYFAQTGSLGVSAVAAATFAFGLSLSQRRLSTPARLLRRRTAGVEGKVTLTDGREIPLDRRALVRPLDRSLSTMSWSTVALAVSVAVARLAGQ